jgi:hypothetical protein
VGVGAAAARRLVAKFGGLPQLQQAGERGELSSHPAAVLRALQAQPPGPGPGGPCPPLAARNLALLRMRQVPSSASGELQQRLGRYLASPGLQGAAPGPRPPAGGACETPSGPCPGPLQALVPLHPAHRWHGSHNAAAVARLAAALQAAGVSGHASGLVAECGLLLDLVVPLAALRAGGGGPGGQPQRQQQQQQQQQQAAAGMDMPWVRRARVAGEAPLELPVAGGGPGPGSAAAVLVYTSWDLAPGGGAAAGGGPAGGAEGAAAADELAAAGEVVGWLRARLERGGRLGRRLQRRLASSGGRNAARARAAGWQVVEVAEEELGALLLLPGC